MSVTGVPGQRRGQTRSVSGRVEEKSWNRSEAEAQSQWLQVSCLTWPFWSTLSRVWRISWASQGLSKHRAYDNVWHRAGVTWSHTMKWIRYRDTCCIGSRGVECKHRVWCQKPQRAVRNRMTVGLQTTFSSLCLFSSETDAKGWGGIMSSKPSLGCRARPCLDQPNST